MLSKPEHFCSQRYSFQISTLLIWCLILLRCWPFYIFAHFMSENGLPKPAILSPFFLQCFCFKFPGALNDAWISLKKKLLDCVWTCWKWQEKLEVIHRGRLHEENDCMFYWNFKKSLKVCGLFLQIIVQRTKLASWVHCVVTVRLFSNISNLYSTCSGPVF